MRLARMISWLLWTDYMDSWYMAWPQTLNQECITNYAEKKKKKLQSVSKRLARRGEGKIIHACPRQGRMFQEKEKKILPTVLKNSLLASVLYVLAWRKKKPSQVNFWTCPLNPLHGRHLPPLLARGQSIGSAQTRRLFDRVSIYQSFSND